jgi:hypothetical protein
MQIQYFFLAIGLLFQVALAHPSVNDVPEFMKWKRSFEERDGVKRTIFEHRATGSKMDYVMNSGVCETTPGVNQYSGSFSVGGELLASS